MTTEHVTAMAPSRALFARVGETLYGPQWQCEVARALGVSDRSVRYWVAGRRIPDGIWQDMLPLFGAKISELRRLERQTRKMVDIAINHPA
jgi:DNA-binding transcriptional regulator YiaG